ncbi:site-specific integrase [Sphaerospermopsis kisseleviana CS-549]|uniref:Site-specific integrase n=2 Tax=Sphaerospermopsis TaxID=752201 RepID=A0ABT4ZQA0_9CYAN|nr:site-specific integrase [Sphaerospermopsis kisseleviana CS-549]BAZ83648.1 phage integrase [Sphaerospermopsis kisseleviana NIES-73]
MDVNNIEVSPVEVLPAPSQVVSRDTSQPVTAELVEEVIRQYYYRTPAVSNDEELILAWAGSQNREQTKRKYYRFGQKLLEWVRKQGIEDLRLVQQPKLLEFVASWGEVSPYTKSNQVLMLRSLWSYGSSENVGYFLRNIASTISYDNFTDLPKAERYLEDWELEQLAHAAQMLGEKHWLVFCLLFYSGMRVGEVGRVTIPGQEPGQPQEDYPGLYWHNFKWQPEPIPGDKHRGYYTIKFRGKGGKYREIGLDHETSLMFKKYRGMAGEKMPVFPNVSPDPKKRGLPLSDRAIKKLIQDISEVAGVKFSCHWLRHSHASRAVDRKTLFEVQDQLGHTKSDTTKTYVRPKRDAGTGTVLPRF